MLTPVHSKLLYVFMLLWGAGCIVAVEGIYSEFNLGMMTIPDSLYDALTTTTEDPEKWPWNDELGAALIPYVIDEHVKDRNLTNAVMSSIKEWTEHTCIGFEELEEKSSGTHLHFKLGPLCVTNLGYRKEGMKHDVFLTEDCAKKGSISTLIAIALGFYHQCLRPDRDSYVKIIQANLGNNLNKLQKVMSTTFVEYGVPYDYTSILSLDGTTLSVNGRTTIATKDIEHQGLLGKTIGKLSHRDKLLINKHYLCLDKWNNQCNNLYPCENEGYVGADCSCICRPGALGQFCEHLLEDHYYGHATPLCSREIVENTKFASPNYPLSVMPGTWCVYKIRAPVHFVSRIIIHDFHLDGKHENLCKKDFLEIGHLGHSYNERYCGRMLKKGATMLFRDYRETFFYLEVESNRSGGFEAEVIFLREEEAEELPIPSVSNMFVPCFQLSVFTLSFLSFYFQYNYS